jgi:hypothetical protein
MRDIYMNVYIYDENWSNSELVLVLQSQADPSEIMREVLKALHELDIVWKSIGAYSIRCRWVPPLPNLSKSCNVSAGNSFSESPMTLGSFPSSEMSFQANGITLDDSELGDQFLVRFEVQVCQPNGFSSHFLFYNLLYGCWKCFVGWSNLSKLETIVLCPVVTDCLEGVIAAFQDKERELFVGSATSWWPQFFVSRALLFLPHRGWGSVNICSLSHDLIFSMANYFLFIWLVSWEFAQTWILIVLFCIFHPRSPT